MSEEKAPYGDMPRQDETKYHISDEAPRDYYSQVPNLVDDLDLTPHAYRLYGHLRRVAGENGKCWQSTTTLAKSCRMSMGSVSDAKKELESTYPPLIRIESKKSGTGIYHEIVITDIWKVNHDLYTGEVVHLVKTPRKPSLFENPPSPCETKNTTVKNTPERQAENLPISPSALPIEWQIGMGVEKITMPDQTEADYTDAANEIADRRPAVFSICMAFQRARGIVLTTNPKGQRKCAQELIRQGVTPETITAAVQKLTEAGMTVTDLFSVAKTAIDLAHPAQSEGYNPQGLEVGF